MQYKLSQLVNYSNDKINSSLLTKLNYISTENMLPNIGGIIKSSNVPLNTNVCKFTKDNILLSNIRPYFHKLYLSTFTGGCSNDVLCFKITNPKIINPKYLYYAMSTKSFINYVVSTSKGTKMPRGDKNAILEYTLNVASIPQQLLIVDTVGSLDDKIENNNKIIERLIIWKANNYKNALSNISCQEYNLLDMVDFIGGTQPPKSEHIYDYKQGYIRFIQNRDYSSENHLTYIKESTKNKLCNEYDIMMDKYGEAGKVRFGISGAYNVALAKIDPKNIAYQEWIREFLNTQEIQQFLFNSSIASTRASVSENNLMNIKIPVPSKDYIAKFEEKHKIIIKFILKLKQENKQLEKLKKLYLSYYF